MRVTGRPRGHARAVLTLGCALTLLAGCSSAQPGDDARTRAMRDARNQAERVENAIEQDHVFEAEKYAHSAGQVDGVEVMRVSGSTRNAGDGVTLVIRVHGVAPVRPKGGRSTEERKHLIVPACFEFKYGPGTSGLRGATDCPSGAPIAIEKDPHLPGDIDVTLRERLPKGGGVTEAAVHRALDGIALDPRVRRDVATVQGAIGIALRASQYACLLARVRPTSVEVWRPSRIQLAPGELSCTAATAAAGAGQRAPH